MNAAARELGLISAAKRREPIHAAARAIRRAKPVGAGQVRIISADQATARIDATDSTTTHREKIDEIFHRYANAHGCSIERARDVCVNGEGW